MVQTKCASNISEQAGQGQGGWDWFTAIYSIQLDIVKKVLLAAVALGHPQALDKVSAVAVGSGVRRQVTIDKK